MSDVIIRNAHIDELSELKAIWETIFEDIGKEAFFSIYFKPDMCIVVEYNNTLVSMGYLVPFGDILCGKKPISCAMIYAIATLPECRGMGFGRLVVNELISLAHKLGYPVVVLCPSDDTLFEYYAKYTNMRDWFYTFEYRYKYADFSFFDDSDIETHTFPLIRISINEYRKLRRKLLKKITHIDHDQKALEYQECLFKELGGGFYRIGNSCAAIEMQADSTVLLKELLVPVIKNRLTGAFDLVHDNPASNTEFASVLASIAHAFPDKEYIVRLPAAKRKGRRFGMLTTSDDIDITKSENFEPWYGFAFD
ncbi:MAG: GNAT family N-acetyltransferase [Oscillospiraceae bacterium]|nr:GNAT family N-acetyltransferase [Oscillospiraceae bacterium]